MTIDPKWLEFTGISRSVLEDRIRALVGVLEAAEELVAADDDAAAATAKDEDTADARYELAWDRLRDAVRESRTSVDNR